MPRPPEIRGRQETDAPRRREVALPEPGRDGAAQRQGAGGGFRVHRHVAASDLRSHVGRHHQQPPGVVVDHGPQDAASRGGGEREDLPRPRRLPAAPGDLVPRPLETGQGSPDVAAKPPAWRTRGCPEWGNTYQRMIAKLVASTLNKATA